MAALSKSFADDVLSSLTAHIAVLDANGVILAVNAAWKRFARENGGADDFYLGANYLAVCENAARNGDPAAAEVLHGIQAVMRGVRDELALEYPCDSPTQKRWFQVRVTRLSTATGLVVAHEDITARKTAEVALQEALAREQALARTDPLTGALNRRRFFDLAEHEFAITRRYGRPLSVILFDVDRFKEVNDTWGHQRGDETLQHVAEIARGQLRESDVFGRYGGEEFVVLLPNTAAQQAAILAERLRAEVAAQGRAAPEGRVGVTISAGVAEASSSSEDTLDHLIHRADQALYAAKLAGRNRTATFPPVVPPVEPPLKAEA